MWRFNPHTQDPELDMGMPEAPDAQDRAAPSRLAPTTSAGALLQLSPDRLTLTYTAPGHQPDAACVQADRPVPHSRGLYYFELIVGSDGERRMVTLGFTSKDNKHNKLPGWERGGYGYHGDDGKAFTNSGMGAAYGPTFSAGDVVGAGLDLVKNEIFFTKNGKHLGIAFRNVLQEPLWPTVGMHSRGESATINLGQRPFCFNIEGYEQKEREQQQDEIDSVHVEASNMHELVKNYLWHHGYADTLAAFRGAAGEELQTGEASTSGQSDDDGALLMRRDLRRAVTAGNVAEAERLILARFPSLLISADLPQQDTQEVDLAVNFYLPCLQMLELIRSGRITHEPGQANGAASQAEAGDATTFARTRMQALRRILHHRSPNYDLMLHDVVALLAYQRPEEAPSPLRQLLEPAQREVFADLLNSCVLAAATGLRKWDERPQAQLERLLRQLAVAQAARREASGEVGPPFDLRSHLLPHKGSRGR